MIVIDRFCYAPWGTYGIMTISGCDAKFYTVEQPWRNNQPFASCIPEGNYRMYKWDSDAHPNTFVLENPQLNVFKYKKADDPSARFACLIHVANVPTDVAGCIGPGTDVGYVKGQWAVLNSGAAMDMLRELIADRNINKVLIRGYDYGMGYSR